MVTDYMCRDKQHRASDMYESVIKHLTEVPKLQVVVLRDGVVLC